MLINCEMTKATMAAKAKLNQVDIVLAVKLSHLSAEDLAALGAMVGHGVTARLTPSEFSLFGEGEDEEAA